MACLSPKFRPAVPREGCLHIYIFEVQLSCCCCVYYTVYCRVRWMQMTRSSEQSCNQRVLQLQAYYHHRWPRIDWEERQRRMKTGHDKRNQGDIIIRHNYVAIGLSRNEGQGDGWARGVPVKKKVSKRERFKRKTRCLIKVCLIDHWITVTFVTRGNGRDKMHNSDFTIMAKKNILFRLGFQKQATFTILDMFTAVKTYREWLVSHQKWLAV